MIDISYKSDNLWVIDLFGLRKFSFSSSRPSSLSKLLNIFSISVRSENKLCGDSFTFGPALSLSARASGETLIESLPLLSIASESGVKISSY